MTSRRKRGKLEYLASPLPSKLKPGVGHTHGLFSEVIRSRADEEAPDSSPQATQETARDEEEEEEGAQRTFPLS